MKNPILTFTLYRDREGDWRWQCEARNGRILCDSGEGYRRIGSARRALERCIGAIRGVSYRITELKA